MGTQSRRSKPPSSQNGSSSAHPLRGGGDGGDSTPGSSNEPSHCLSTGSSSSKKKNNSNKNNDRLVMNTKFELLRRNRPDDRSPQALAMTHEDFSLDEEPRLPGTPIVTNHGFFELPAQDRRSFGLLVLLYFLQGVPLGLATGSVPFLLKNHMSYGEIGVFSLASYPYSLKLLWSPVVDALWSPRVGRRKSWILPIQLLSGIGMLWLGARVEAMMAATGKPGGPTVWAFTGWWFFLVFMCATQDIAVDGWALTLLTPGNVSYASTAQTVGLTAGQFLSYTVFLAFYSKDFANRWSRPADAPGDAGLLSLGGYLTFWGWVYIAVTVGLAVLKREERSRDEEGIWDVYKIMAGVLRLRNVQTILLVHLIAKLGFQANDAVTNLKLVDKGFGTDNMALIVLVDFPFEIALSYYAGKWSQEFTPMRLWCWGFVGRLAAAVMAQAVVAMFPVTAAAGGVPFWYIFVVMAEHVFSTFTSTIMFVAMPAFHARIADPVIGGTYMTLLATVSNLGGTFPRFFVLRLVDGLTSATCQLPAGASAAILAATPRSCAVQADKELCLAAGGACHVARDGYYMVNVACVLVGAVTFVLYIRPKVLWLQDLPLRSWRLAPPQQQEKARGHRKGQGSGGAPAAGPSSPWAPE